jgi:hypothetical protein
MKLMNAVLEYVPYHPHPPQVGQVVDIDDSGV